ncbi:hypothetical protein EMIHUDRAFT_200284 [Emiliania huxleyi CCMP1516]|nr:hypothetical protein EMIHUDRAFT_200284 [Emiliania huxleyi CCMP1516]EOD39694.1 hypothetical protein EMIHUDRAFT_200284 [Emiliania huxleyi CCMP1516]|mmetsp:Transcript_44775/g.144151  ORF Transcript_44775/g.144151 Transcript_44775/m.144151 type:complete len:143 (-) Transcript_44775:186-614(-)|eukprot:XP_005792123.1 hypothetical protein EMIHUDRAFT_200284 [Emiliania huxleyi CCMP1516]
MALGRLSTGGHWVTPEYLLGRPAVADADGAAGESALGPPAAAGESAQAPTVGCPCCIGPPDTAFEDAYEGICALGLDGINTETAAKFVRLCANDRSTMRLSKNKAKLAAKLRKPPLSIEELVQMQHAVFRAYRMICTTLSPL